MNQNKITSSCQVCKFPPFDNDSCTIWFFTLYTPMNDTKKQTGKKVS